MIDLPVGTLIEVVESESCDGCIFQDSHVCPETQAVPICVSKKRFDKKDVIFREVNRKELFGYDSDLSNVQVGDYVWHQAAGKWLEVKKVLPQADYPIYLGDENVTVTFDGKYIKSWANPAAFIRPPACFNAGPRPEPEVVFEKDERVEVSHDGISWHKRHYSSKNSDGFYRCFSDGKTSWTTSRTHPWKYCRKWEEEK